MGNLRSTIVEKHYADMNEDRWDETRRLFHDDVVSVMPGGPEIHGVESFLEYGRIFKRAFPDMRMTMRSCVEDGDSVVAEGVLSATHTGPLATPDGREIPATGKRVEMPFADAFDVEDGKVRRHRVYFDQMGLMAQLGLLPQPSTA